MSTSSKLQLNIDIFGITVAGRTGEEWGTGQGGSQWGTGRRRERRRSWTARRAGYSGESNALSISFKSMPPFCNAHNIGAPSAECRVNALFDSYRISYDVFNNSPMRFDMIWRSPFFVGCSGLQRINRKKGSARIPGKVVLHPHSQMFTQSTPQLPSRVGERA